jgi:hypothetical protein
LSRPILFSDHDLSRRLERAEGMANAAFVEARAKLNPASNAEWMEVSGTHSMFDTPDSPITQTFGLGMFARASASDLDRIEEFFTSRGAHVHHEISPFADASVWPLIARRHYEPFEFTSILCLDLQNVKLPEPQSANGLQVRLVTSDEADLYAETSARGWGHDPSSDDSLSALMRTSFAATGVSAFIVEKEGCAIAAGSLNIQNGVALLAGACTIPEARRQGAQGLLLAARLKYAADAGCDLAAMGTLPGSESQRNAQRSGFQITYTRTKWRLPASTV